MSRLEFLEEHVGESRVAAKLLEVLNECPFAELFAPSPCEHGDPPIQGAPRDCSRQKLRQRLMRRCTGPE